jgi:EAL domain-containing protein (putative c-di-GMP-specific phosphodiesterase class I)
VTRPRPRRPARHRHPARADDHRRLGRPAAGDHAGELAARAGTLVSAVAQLGHSLGLTVIAEGVETPAQLALVRSAQCDAVQGFLVARPLPEPDARLFLEWAASTDEIAALMSAPG